MCSRNPEDPPRLPCGSHPGRNNQSFGKSYDTFVRRLNNWANYRLKGGVEALPEGLQIRENGDKNHDKRK